jgi:hypothetical protein
MSFLTSEIKRPLYWGLAWIFTFINFTAFIVSRNQTWIQNPGRAWMNASATEFRNYPASDFERTLSCYGFGQCQRIGGALIVQPIIFFGDFLSKFYYFDFNENSQIFVIQMSGLAWRIFCIGFLGLIVHHFSLRLSVTLFFLNFLFLTLSGVILRGVGRLIDLLPISSSQSFAVRSTSAFRDFPFENLAWYDFGLFFAIALIIYLVVNNLREDISFKKLFLFGLFLTAFFEFLGFVFALSLVATLRSSKTVAGKSRIEMVKIFSAALVGTPLWLLLIYAYQKIVKSNFPQFFTENFDDVQSRSDSLIWALKNPIANLISSPSLVLQIILTLIQCSVFAFISGRIARKLFRFGEISSKFLLATKSVMCSFILITLVTFFIAYGVNLLAGEHARQTIGIQISLFMYLFFKSMTFPNKAEVEGLI